MMFQKVASLQPETHRRLTMISTASMTIAALALGLYLRFDTFTLDRISLGGTLVPLIILLVTRFAFYQLYGLFDTRWRYTSSAEALNIAKTHIFSSICLVASLSFLQLPVLPRSVLVGECLFSILFAFGARLIVRAISEYTFLSESKHMDQQRQVLIVGAGISGHLFVRTIMAQPRLQYLPVGFLDDSPCLTGSHVHGIPVLGPLSSLSKVLEKKNQIAAVIVAIPNLSPLKMKELKEASDRHHVPLKHLQSFEEIACADPFEPKTRLTVEEVLNRDVQLTDDPRILAQIQGKSVLITGAGGSIGSELVRQVLSFAPSRVVLVDKSEYNLYAIEQEIRSTAPETQKVLFLGSIVDEKRLEKAFAQYQPDVVFHAAAFKHVPLLESNCYEAYVNNIIGTRNLLHCSKRWGVERFVLISSDKAVDPSSVMGATKRIKEIMVGHANQYFSSKNGVDSHMHTAVVRFGNVINSSGSVIPLFKRQILEGRPLTVTHPKMDRYFMSIREAVRLVLTAGTLGQDGEIFLLDMGKPIKIVDVAKKLLALYGRRDLPIVFSGLREGEKLSEVLYSTSETRTSTQFDKVFAVHSLYQTPQNVYEWVDRLSDRIIEMPDAEIGAAIHQFVADANSALADECASLQLEAATG